MRDAYESEEDKMSCNRPSSVLGEIRSLYSSGICNASTVSASPSVLGLAPPDGLVIRLGQEGRHVLFLGFSVEKQPNCRRR